MKDYIFTIRQKVHIYTNNDKEATSYLKANQPFVRIWGISKVIESLPGIQVLRAERRELTPKEEKDLEKWRNRD